MTWRREVRGAVPTNANMGWTFSRSQNSRKGFHVRPRPDGLPISPRCCGRILGGHSLVVWLVSRACSARQAKGTTRQPQGLAGANDTLGHWHAPILAGANLCCELDRRCGRSGRATAAQSRSRVRAREGAKDFQTRRAS